MMLESGPICLVRPSAVGITHKKWVPGKTLENCIHKDRRRNVGCVHHRKNLPYKFNNSYDTYGDVQNRNFEKSHRTTDPRSDLRPDPWS